MWVFLRRVLGSSVTAAVGMVAVGGLLLSIFILPKMMDIAAHSVSNPADADLLRLAGSFWGFWVVPLAVYAFVSALLGCLAFSWWQNRGRGRHPGSLA